MKSLVSILIPAYNSEKWIGETIQSALCQTWSNKEIIIVNDGSTDSTFDIAKNYESKIVKVRTQENRGACAARNKALEYSQGDYIQWLDADDILHPEKISKQMEAAQTENDPHVLYTSPYGKFFFRIRNAKFQQSSLWQDLSPVEWIFNKLHDNAWMNPAAWLVSRKLSEMGGSWDERLSLDDDGEYICRIVSKSKKVKFVPDAKCYYRVGLLGSLSGDLKRSDKKLESIFLSICLQNKYLLDFENSERTRAACIGHLQGYYIFFFPERLQLVEKANVYANGLGGRLVPPDLKWEYKIIKKVFGWGVAKTAIFMIPKGKMLILKHYDKHFNL
jgi:glycosyltransferase involved in cell wall biosynthesis